VNDMNIAIVESGHIGATPGRLAMPLAGSSPARPSIRRA